MTHNKILFTNLKDFFFSFKDTTFKVTIEKNIVGVRVSLYDNKKVNHLICCIVYSVDELLVEVEPSIEWKLAKDLLKKAELL